MPHYKFEAVDSAGKKVKGDVEAATPQEAITRIKGKGYRPMNLKVVSEQASGQKESAGTSPAGGGSGVKTPAKKFSKNTILFGKVKSKERAQFTQQLSVLLDAGLPIVRSLKILANQLKPSMLKNVVTEVADDVETGSSLSEALGKHPKAFDKLYVNMVKAGEAGGVLDVILQRLAYFLEKAEALKRKLIGALIYPSVVITIALLVVFFIVVFIVPQFEDIFRKQMGTLPAMTQFLMDTSKIVGKFWFVFLAMPFMLFFLFKAYAKTQQGRFQVDRFKLHMPMFGTIIRKAVIARFCRTLGTLLQSGVPILEAMNIVKNAVGNEVVSQAIGHVHDSIREGDSIVDPLASSKIFDDIVINMIAVGEETGELDKMLLKIADTYDAEVDAAVSALMSILEPAMIVGLGVTVGFIVLAVFMPMIQMIQTVSNKKPGGG